MPSSSARCAQFPRAQDKVHYYIKLQDLRDQLKGIASNTEVQERMLKRWPSKKKNTVQVTKQRMEELTVTVRRRKANSTISLQMELVKFGAWGIQPVNHYSQLKNRGKMETANIFFAIDPQYCEGSSFSEVPDGQWMTRSFADQIPEFGAGLTREEEGSGA